MPRHWPEYLMEAGGLALFMLSASAMATLIFHPAFPVRAAVSDPVVRRVLMGLAMGLTATGLIYSPWGRRSGAHLNPSVTLTFLRLGKVSPSDAIGYWMAQFAGGLLGTRLAALFLAPWIADPSVNYVATTPGALGPAAAFGGEVAIAFTLMTVVLTVSNTPRIADWTGVVAGLLVWTFIVVEDPLSGMSMNPARTLGPALIGGTTTGLWIYFVAPPLGMLAAAEVFTRVRGRAQVHCAKLHHRGPCIFCAATERRATSDATSTLSAASEASSPGL